MQLLRIGSWQRVQSTSPQLRCNCCTARGRWEHPQITGVLCDECFDRRVIQGRASELQAGDDSGSGQCGYCARRGKLITVSVEGDPDLPNKFLICSPENSMCARHIVAIYL